MRLAISCIFLAFSFFGFSSQEYKVISKGNYKGLASATGEELIPAVYDNIGWSDGTTKPLGEIIGYESNGRWGIISLNNKKVTKAVYYLILPYSDDHIKAAIKGNFSNHLFYGLLDLSGDVKTNFQYFDISPQSGGHSISVYEQGKVIGGWMNDYFKVIIPPEYQQITSLNHELMVASIDGVDYIFNKKSGLVSAKGYDRIEQEGNYIRVVQKGKVGLLQQNGLQQAIPTDFKEVRIVNGVIQTTNFPEWTITKVNLSDQLKIHGDSAWISEQQFITYINGNQQVVINGTDIFGERRVAVQMAKSGFMIAKDLISHESVLITTAGQVIIDQQDSIFFDNLYFYALSNQEWQVFNRFGRKLSLKRFEAVKESIENVIPVKRNGFWGLMDFQGEMVTPIKFDGFGEGYEGKIVANYLGRLGVLDLFGEWVIKPDYDDVNFCQESIIARKGMLHEIFDLKGDPVYSSYSSLSCSEVYILIQDQESGYGLMLTDGNVLLDPIYSKVGKMGDCFWGKGEDYCVMVNESGKYILTGNDQVTEVLDFSENYFKIKKDGMTGFVDRNGNLRIANRYTDAKRFEEGLAPIRLNGKWGFVDQAENLVIQPYYDEVWPMNMGMAIVKKGDHFGVINQEGREVIGLNYQQILHQNDRGYLLVSIDGKYGFADVKGSVILTPSYLSISEAPEGLLIVNQNGLFGIMDLRGFTRVPFEYQELYVKDDYFFMKKLVNN